MKIKNSKLVKGFLWMLLDESLHQVKMGLCLDTMSRSLTMQFSCLCEVHASQKQVLQKFKEHIAVSGTPCILRSDNGTNYTIKTFTNFCTNNKIKREYTVTQNPEQNGVAEQYNRTVVETA